MASFQYNWKVENTGPSYDFGFKKKACVRQFTNPNTTGRANDFVDRPFQAMDENRLEILATALTGGLDWSKVSVCFDDDN